MTKTNKLFATLVALLIVQVPVFAKTELSDPGITPDSFLHILDVAIDNLALALTFNHNARIEKELRIAEERLAEARLMATKGNVQATEIAVQGHGEILTKLKAEIRDVANRNASTELRKELEIEQKIKQHRKTIEMVKLDLTIKVEGNGNLTNEQQRLLEAVLTNLEGQTGEVEIEIKNEKGKTKIKIEQELETDAEEVEFELKHELGIAVEEKQRAEEEIMETQQELQEFLKEISRTGINLTKGILAEVNAHLDKAMKELVAGNFELAEKFAVKARLELVKTKAKIEHKSEAREETDEEDREGTREGNEQKEHAKELDNSGKANHGKRNDTDVRVETKSQTTIGNDDVEVNSKTAVTANVELPLK